jgi:hypothetical protein
MGDFFSFSHPSRVVVSPLSVDDFLYSVARTPTPARFEKRRRRRLEQNCISVQARKDRLCYTKDNNIGSTEPVKEQRKTTTGAVAPSAISIHQNSPEHSQQSLTVKDAVVPSYFAKLYSAQSINSGLKTKKDNEQRCSDHSVGCASAKHSPSTQQHPQQTYNGEIKANATFKDSNER